jgi:hypothetical protein
MSAIPPEASATAAGAPLAVKVAAECLAHLLGLPDGSPNPEPSDRDRRWAALILEVSARRMVEAAAPHIIDAERARIIELARSEARRHQAYGSGMMAAGVHSFADLLACEEPAREERRITRLP